MRSAPDQRMNSHFNMQQDMIFDARRGGLSWARIVEWLGGRAPRPPGGSGSYVPSDACQVACIEQESAITVTMRWVDSTGCSYQAQIWRKGTARIHALCALSGLPIAPGDAVFRPDAGKQGVKNRREMVHAHAVDACFGAIVT